MPASSPSRGPSKIPRGVLVLGTLFLGMAFPPLARGHADLLLLIDNLSQRIKTQPAQADLYLLRGELYRAHADWQLAQTDYDHAAQLNPQLAAVDLARGKLLTETGRDPEARIMLDRYLSRQPDDIDGLVTRGQLLARSGQPKPAVADFTRAIAQAATPLPDYFLQRARAQMALGELTEALEGLDQGLQRLGPQVALQLQAIELECTAKHFDRALVRLETLARTSDRKEKWLAHRGQILALAGRADEAQKCFREALAAIESLPPRQRTAPAMTELRNKITSALGD